MHVHYAGTSRGMKTTSKIIVLAVAIVAAVIVILILISTPISVYCCSFQRNNQHPDESTPHELKRFTCKSILCHHRYILHAI